MKDSIARQIEQAHEPQPDMFRHRPMTDDQVAVDTRGTFTATTMPTADRDEWRRLAEAATPRPWQQEDNYVTADHGDRFVCDTSVGSIGTEADMRRAAYIAHSSPDRVLALLEENAVLRAILDAAQYENLDALLAEPEPRRAALARAVGNAARSRTLEIITGKEQAEARIATLEAAIRAHRAAWQASRTTDEYQWHAATLRVNAARDAMWALVPELER